MKFQCLLFIVVLSSAFAACAKKTTSEHSTQTETETHQNTSVVANSLHFTDLQLGETQEIVIDFQTRKTRAKTNVEIQAAEKPFLLIDAKGVDEQELKTQLFRFKVKKEENKLLFTLREQKSACTKETCTLQITLGIPLGLKLTVLQGKTTTVLIPGDTFELR